MWDYHVIGIAAVGEHAEAFHRAAEILLTAPARAAGTAADPRMRNHPHTDLDALRVRSGRHHLAYILVPERHWQLHATVGETQALAAAKIEPAIGEMQIAMADARREHFKQHLRARRLRRRLLVAFQRLAADAELKHSHVSPLGPGSRICSTVRWDSLQRAANSAQERVCQLIRSQLLTKGTAQCPLSGVKQTSHGNALMSAFDPKRTCCLLGGRYNVPASTGKLRLSVAGVNRC